MLGVQTADARIAKRQASNQRARRRQGEMKRSDPRSDDDDYALVA